MTRSEKAIFQNFADILLEHMPVGVALYDAQDFRLLAANTLFHSLLNPAWQNGRAVGHPPADWIVGANVTYIEKMLRSVVETGIPYRASEHAIHSSFHGTTYWALTIDPIRDNDGHVIQLLQTANDVTAQVRARQQAEQASILLSQENRTVEAERKRLEVIETVARSVRTFLDVDSIGKAAVEAISTSFHPIRLTIHVADSVQRKLDLLPGSMYFSPGNKPKEQTINASQHIQYDTAWLISQAYKHRNPIIIGDLQATDTFTTIRSDNPLRAVPGARSYICIPLWFKDNFEGTLVCAPSAASPSRASISPTSSKTCSISLAFRTSSSPSTWLPTIWLPPSSTPWKARPPLPGSITSSLCWMGWSPAARWWAGLTGNASSRC